MATIVCQGLEAMTLRLKLSTPKPHLSSSQSLELTFKPKQPEVSGGGWSFLQALSPLKKDEEEVYVHPQVKRMEASRGDKSLAMCTEHLGSETGSDEMVPDFNTLLSMSTSPKEKRRPKTRKPSGHFPPPLTTMSGSERLRLRAHRESRRLVMEAVKTRTCFRSTRSHGRLRLYFLQMDHCQYEQEYEDNRGQRVQETEHCVDKEQVREGGLDTDGNNFKFGGKTGIEECHQRPRRCIQGEIQSRKSLHWEPFWVATS